MRIFYNLQVSVSDSGDPKMFAYATVIKSSSNFYHSRV